ncbi:MAG: protein jag [Alicyclobacillus sp.]|nr:protein jag [Alicyclobacillus sp.]
MKRVVATGKTIDDAITSALVRLGVTRSQATIRVISEPVKGLFGLFGGKDAEVEVTVNLTPPEVAKDFLVDALAHMGIEARVRMHGNTDQEATDVELEIICNEESLPHVIGKHGVTLDSLQYLVNAVANKGLDKYYRFYVDAGDYRRRRREGLCSLAERAALKAIRTKKPVVLNAMSAADRKIIHTFLQEHKGVTTTSEGTEPNRKVVIVPLEASTTSSQRFRVSQRGSFEAN